MGVSIVDEEEFRDLKTSRWKIRLLAWKAREGSRGGNEGASSDWSGREEIASRLVIITPLTRLPLPPIVLSIIFVIELLATKSPSTPSSLSFDVARIYLVQSRPTTTVSLSSTSISSRVQHSIFDTSCERERNERWLSICLQHPLRFDDASLSSISGEQRRTVHFFRSKKNWGIMKRTERYFQEFNYIQILLIPLHNSNRELDVIISTRDSSSSTNFRFEIQRDRNIRIKLKPSTLTSIFTPREFFPSVLWKSTSLRHLVDDLKFAT